MIEKVSTKNVSSLVNLLHFLLLGIIGLLIILVCSVLQHVAPPVSGEYHYSSFLKNNLTLLAIGIFSVTGFAVGYFLKFNPWFTGMGLIMIFPFTAIAEASFYRGSHNLIPFELAIYAFYSLAPVVTAYAGKLLAQKIKK